MNYPKLSSEMLSIILGEEFPCYEGNLSFQ